MMTDSDSEIEIIPPQAAAEIIDREIAALRSEGWVIVTQSDYAARLTRDRMNRDVRVDLLGEVSYEDKPLTIEQESGRLAAMLLLMIFFFLLLTIAGIIGLID
ncbi:MAG: hypothetical protein ACLFTK_09125 [Anaerolineales bacterium]